MRRGAKESVPNSHTDVLIVCALDVEFDALRQTLAGGSGLVRADDDWRATKHFFASDRRFDAVVVQLPTPSAGNVTSAALTSNLMQLVNPALVVSFGIAGTLKETEIPPRTVVYSQTVYYIDLRKDAADGGEDVKQMPSVGTAGELLKELDELKTSGAKKVVIVSSESVVKTPESKRRDIARHSVSDASVIEMEAFGVLQACAIEKSLYNTARFWVAIKGISDKADLTKNDELHRPAADAAAAFLATLIADRAIKALFKRSTVYTNPPRFRRFRVVADVDDHIDLFKKLAVGALGIGVDDAMLFAAHLRTQKPRIFYHWRLTGIGLHWVDLRFISVLRTLAEVGYPVECLLTDTRNSLTFNKLCSDEDYEAAKVAVEKILRGLFRRSNFDLTLYSRVRGEERVLSSFTDQSGGQQALTEALIKAQLERAVQYSPDVTTEFNLWFRHIAWRSRFDGTCIVLINPSHPNTYAQLRRFGDFVPAIVPTPEIRLGGVIAKTNPPGTDLYLHPPGHEAICEWLAATNDVDLLSEFLGHLTFIGVDLPFIRDRQQWVSSSEEVRNAIPGDPAWLDAFAENRAPQADFYRGAIAVELARWTMQTGLKAGSA